ncbi:MAG: NUMOD3 domain-containing DNA-binding protein [Candidatus Omnitrophota bacterium]
MARGKKHSLATKRRISLSQKGKKNSMYGRRHKTSTKIKLSRINSGKQNPMSGRRHSAETKRKISLAARRRRLKSK